jgi:acyl-coenzyme A thioesterase PaaI-like protein
MAKSSRDLSQQLQKGVINWVNQVSQPTARSTAAGKLKMSAALTLMTRFIGQSIPFARRNHFKVVDFKSGYVKAFIPLKSNSNHFNSMYAGALFTVAELPGGIISIFSFGDDYFPVLKDLKMDFVKMAKSDVTVEFSMSGEELKRIEAEVAKCGKSAFVLEGEIKDSSNEIVATSCANYQVLKKR